MHICWDRCRGALHAPLIQMLISDPLLSARYVSQTGLDGQCRDMIMIGLCLQVSIARQLKDFLDVPEGSKLGFLPHVRPSHSLPRLCRALLLQLRHLGCGHIVTCHKPTTSAWRVCVPGRMSWRSLFHPDSLLVLKIRCSNRNVVASILPNRLSIHLYVIVAHACAPPYFLQ